MTVGNDTRGWILTIISALACVFGASFVCIDFLVRLLPGKQDFNIKDSNAFLSCSLSLSAGTMMLPSARSSLELGGFSPKNAAWMLIACFLAGVWGIQIVSRVLHHFMASEVVDCDHTHDDDDESDLGENKSRQNSVPHKHHAPSRKSTHNGGPSELDPLLSGDPSSDSRLSKSATGPEMSTRDNDSPLELGTWHKPSLTTRMSMKVTEFVSGNKASCDQEGHCKGFSNPCGLDCFKNLNANGGVRSKSISARSTLRHSVAATNGLEDGSDSFKYSDEEAVIDQARPYSASSAPPDENPLRPSRFSHSSFNPRAAWSSVSTSAAQSCATGHRPSEAIPHHHHVPQNAFLSLSLQTSAAIALHKIPEGFITYATNHANPELGLAVFLALAIHNVTEGFALALPIYLATNSRIRCLLYSLILGGFSQPIGAGIAALWLSIAEYGRGDFAPGEAAYGGMFAATAGIMASVGLNLLQQSFELSHNKGLCMFFAFVGMGILGIGSALTA